MQITALGNKLGARGLSFLKELPRDWKVTSIRSALNRFFYQMLLPYLSIYTKALGASGTQLGMINSIGLGVSGFLGPVTGTLIDRFGPKKVYLVGISFLALCYLIYGVAQNWLIVILAMLFYWLGYETTTQGCIAVCATALTPDKRATAMSLCETFAMGLLGMLGPLLGASLVTRFGGANISGIRPLFYVALAGMIFTFFLILTQLSNRNWSGSGKKQTGFFTGLNQVFSSGYGLKRAIVVIAITFLPMGMVIPFTHVFARDAKLATPQVLGWMTTGFAFTPFVLGIPIGRLADRIGRKKVLYVTGFLYQVSLILLVIAPSAAFLVFSGILQGFYSVNTVLITAMLFEMVPKELMGRWIGIVRFFRLLLAAGAAYFAGFIADKFGMQYIFLGMLALDLIVRMPLFITIPETLKKSMAGR